MIMINQMNRRQFFSFLGVGSLVGCLGVGKSQKSQEGFRHIDYWKDINNNWQEAIPKSPPEEATFIDDHTEKIWKFHRGDWISF